jgi:cytochrome c oxidase accessory protein FixG
MEAAKALDGEHFRDQLSNVNKTGKRLWIFPKKPKGFYTNARTYVSWLLMGLLFAGPYIKINGHPIMLFNLLERKFIVFGIPFMPQDFMLFALAMLSGIVLVVLFTAVFGRVFCGWVCPQTVFMEMLFRKIEYWIDGDWTQQKKLAASPWTNEKIRKRVLKHSLFFILAFWISNTFLAYVNGWDELSLMIKDGPMAHVGSFIALLVFAGVLYFVFAFFRELVCIYVCPYGRLQGVMLDKNSVVVAYDYLRGEPRGKMKKGTDTSQLGDCIDCKLCVNVCPTGIDIRNGTQLECVNCTACIDACDEVMESINKPKGLIRYDSMQAISEGKKWKMTKRAYFYSAILVVLLSTLTYFLATRRTLEATILRTVGTLFQEQEGGKYSNMFNVEFVNKSFNTKTITLKILEPDQAELKVIGNPEFVAEAGEVVKGTLMVIIPGENIKTNNQTIILEALTSDNIKQQLRANFVGPVKKK